MMPGRRRIDTSRLPQAKPEPRKRIKAREKRAEARVVKTVRPRVVDRDGYCRIATRFPGVDVAGPCWGPSEWAHLGRDAGDPSLRSRRRSLTVGEDPERRHTTAGTAQLCRQHHAMEERGTIQHAAQVPDAGADGPLTWTTPRGVFVEEPV